MSNLALYNSHKNPNDEFYTSADEVDYVMSRLVLTLPKKTLYIFGADQEWSEWVKWAKEHKLAHFVYNIDLFKTPGLVLLNQDKYDKIIIVTNPPFSVLKYYLNVLALVLKELPTKFCYFLLIPLLNIMHRYSRQLWTAKHNIMHVYTYPGKQMMHDGTHNKEVNMNNVVFTTNLKMDELFPIKPPTLDYLKGHPLTVLLPCYALRYERYFNEAGYKLVCWEVRPGHNTFAKQLWVLDNEVLADDEVWNRQNYEPDFKEDENV